MPYQALLPLGLPWLSYLLCWCFLFDLFLPISLVSCWDSYEQIPVQQLAAGPAGGQSPLSPHKIQLPQQRHQTLAEKLKSAISKSPKTFSNSSSSTKKEQQPRTTTRWADHFSFSLFIETLKKKFVLPFLKMDLYGDPYGLLRGVRKKRGSIVPTVSKQKDLIGQCERKPMRR